MNTNITLQAYIIYITLLKIYLVTPNCVGTIDQIHIKVAIFKGHERPSIKYMSKLPYSKDKLSYVGKKGYPI